MSNRYDWGIYSGIDGIPWDRTEKDVNVRNQVLYMLNRSLLMFKYHNLPDSIPAIELERILQTNGYAGITEVNGKLYALYGGLGGMYDAYGRPTIMTVANPWLRFNATLKIDEDVILMRNDTMMVGLVPIFSKYSTIMNENEITMILASISKRVNNLISVADDNTAESARVYLKKLEEGDLGYIMESKLFDSLKTSPMGSGGHVDLTELIELQQYLKASMYNEIGLNANYNMKRERLNTSEVEMNSDNLYPLVDNMLEHRRIALEQVNEKYGLNIEVEFNSSWDYRVNHGESIDTKGLGLAEGEVEEEKLIQDVEEGLDIHNEPEEDESIAPDEETLNPNGTLSSAEKSDDQEEDNVEPVEEVEEETTEEGEEETNDEPSEVSADSTGDSSDAEADRDVSTEEDGIKDETDVARDEEVEVEDDTETEEEDEEEDKK